MEVWDTTPMKWWTRVVVSIFKKGDRRVRSNYRGSHYSASTGKFTPWCWRGSSDRMSILRLRRSCVVFGTGWGTLDQIFTLAQLLKGPWEFDHPVYVFCGLGKGLRLCYSRDSVGVAE